jgi:hypothetical protein
MGRNRLVYPEEVRLTLSDGDYIDVKKELNAGEYRKLLYDQFKDSDGEKVVLDHSKLGIVKLLAYLLGWSFVGRNNEPIPYNVEQPEEIRRATIDSLDRDTYRELIAAVTAHEERQEAALEAKKNVRATVPASSTI